MDGPHRESPERVESPSPYISHEEPLPPILTLAEVAAYFDRKPNTIYEWKARGILDNAYRKRGKHLFFWRDKVTKLKHEMMENKDEFFPIGNKVKIRKSGKKGTWVAHFHHDGDHRKKV